MHYSHTKAVTWTLHDQTGLLTHVKFHRSPTKIQRRWEFVLICFLVAYPSTSEPGFFVPQCHFSKYICRLDATPGSELNYFEICCRPFDCILGLVFFKKRSECRDILIVPLRHVSGARVVCLRGLQSGTHDCRDINMRPW